MTLTVKLTDVNQLKRALGGDMKKALRIIVKGMQNVNEKKAQSRREAKAAGATG